MCVCCFADCVTLLSAHGVKTRRQTKIDLKYIIQPHKSPRCNDYLKCKIFKRRGMELSTPSGTSYPDPEDASLNRLPGRRYRSLFVLGLRLWRTNPLLTKQSYQNLIKGPYTKLQKEWAGNRSHCLCML